MDFKVGDRVRIKMGAVNMDSLHVPEMRCLEGRSGTIVNALAEGRAFKVAVDDYEGKSWWWRSTALEPVCTPNLTWRIIIEGDKNTSRAKYIEGKKIVKEASAKRYHKDKHDPAMAARALIGKMFPEEKKPEKPKYFTGRVVCVERPEGVWLTVGKIYEVNDGTMSCDVKYVDIDKVTSVENLNSRVKKGVKFIEIKE